MLYFVMLTLQPISRRFVHLGDIIVQKQRQLEAELIHSAGAGNISKLRHLLERGVDKNVCDDVRRHGAVMLSLFYLPSQRSEIVHVLLLVHV